MSGHTPGPWSVEPTPDVAFGKNWKRIRASSGLVVHAGTFIRTRNGESEVFAGVEMTDADARLLAASPTLRDEIEALAADLDVWASMPDVPESVRRAMRARALTARAAIPEP